MDTRVKIISPERARDLVLSRIAAGERIAVVKGWFDVLRSTHCEALDHASIESSYVVVLVHADTDARPTVLDEQSRAQLVAALGAADCVVICDQALAEELTVGWKPPVIVDAEESVSGNVVEDVLQRYRSR